VCNFRASCCMQLVCVCACACVCKMYYHICVCMRAYVYVCICTSPEALIWTVGQYICFISAFSCVQVTICLVLTVLCVCVCVCVCDSRFLCCVCHQDKLICVDTQRHYVCGVCEWALEFSALFLCVFVGVWGLQILSWYRLRLSKMCEQVLTSNYECM
jgi:hypothetical protein